MSGDPMIRDRAIERAANLIQQHGNNYPSPPEALAEALADAGLLTLPDDELYEALGITPMTEAELEEITERAKAHRKAVNLVLRRSREWRQRPRWIVARLRLIVAVDALGRLEKQ